MIKSELHPIKPPVSTIKRLFTHRLFIPFIATLGVAAVIIKYVNLAQLLNTPLSMIMGGIWIVVGVHLIGILAVAYTARRNQQRSETEEETSIRIQHENKNDLETKGQTIPWASFYDTLVWVLSFGKGSSIRKDTVVLADAHPGETVLDVGCGTGDLALALQQIVGQTGNVCGTDASPKMIEVAKRKATKHKQVIFQTGLIEKIGFPDNHFDLVTNTLVMHHLPKDLKQAGLTEINRVLKPSGRILIVDIQSSSGGSLFQRMADFMVQLHGGHAIMHDNVQKLVPLLKETGFNNIETGKLNRQMSYIKAKKL
ncbi:MAG: methyltransferase domain-containing protein [Candidatus Marinimicrobia bacterium]|nr:methyltransferase domain-containing protein [Candidatus Neomarinimicrobiota bacterium]